MIFIFLAVILSGCMVIIASDKAREMDKAEDTDFVDNNSQDEQALSKNSTTNNDDNGINNNETSGTEINDGEKDNEKDDTTEKENNEKDSRKTDSNTNDEKESIIETKKTINTKTDDALKKEKNDKTKVEKEPIRKDDAKKISKDIEKTTSEKSIIDDVNELNLENEISKIDDSHEKEEPINISININEDNITEEEEKSDTASVTIEEAEYTQIKIDVGDNDEVYTEIPISDKVITENEVIDISELTLPDSYDEYKKNDGTETITITETNTTEKINIKDVPGWYSVITNIDEHYSIVRVDNDKYGVIEKLGQLSVPVDYDGLFVYISEAIRARRDNKYGVISKTGEIIIPVKYDEIIHDWKLINTKHISSLTGRINNKYTEIEVVNTDGISIPAQYDDAVNLTENLIRVRKAYEYGLAGDGGKLVIPVKYDGIKKLSEKYFLVKKDNLYGVMNNQGLKVLPVKYESINLIDGDKFQIKLNDKYGIITETGKFVVNFDVDEFNDIEKRSAREIMPRNNKKNTFTNKNHTLSFTVAEKKDINKKRIIKIVFDTSNKDLSDDIGSMMEKTLEALDKHKFYSKYVLFAYLNKPSNSVVDIIREWER